MKYTIVSVLILGVLTFLIACKSKQMVSKAELKSPVMTLAKSSCFGKCKVYKVKVYKDRTVSYEGIKHVDNIGLFRSSITASEYESLAALFETADFQNLGPEYLTPTRDVQKMTLGFYEKKVKYQNRAASDELKVITKSIDEIIEKLEWKKN